MSRHRATVPVEEEESSDSDSDVFATLSKDKANNDVPKKKKRPAPKIQFSTLSSNKRHHGAKSSERQLKMDAVLEELKMAKIPSTNNSTARPSTHSNRTSTGSFVDPEHEHTTTNVFVGNLPPTVNESVVAEFFSAFGEKKVALQLLLCPSHPLEFRRTVLGQNHVATRHWRFTQ